MKYEFGGISGERWSVTVEADDLKTAEEIAYKAMEAGYSYGTADEIEGVVESYFDYEAETTFGLISSEKEISPQPVDGLVEIVVKLSVDKAAVLKESGCDSLSDAIDSELGWLQNSGIAVQDWSYREPKDITDMALSVQEALTENVLDKDNADFNMDR